MRTPRSEYPSEQADKFLLRMPDGMKERLKEAASASKRSMNAEIVARLEESFAPPHDFGVAPPGWGDELRALANALIETSHLKASGKAKVELRVIVSEPDEDGAKP